MCLTTWRTDFIEDTTLPQLYRCATCNRNCTDYIFNKLEVIRLDSTLSVLIIIRTIHTLSWCQNSGKIQSEFYSDLNTHISISRGFKIFRLLSRPFATAHWRCKKRVYFLWT